MEGTTTRRSCGRCLARKYFAWSMKAPPPTTTSVSADSGTSLSDATGAMLKVSSTRSTTLGVAQTTVVGWQASFNHPTSCACGLLMEPDAFRLENPDEVSEALDTERLF